MAIILKLSSLHSNPGDYLPLILQVMLAAYRLQSLRPQFSSPNSETQRCTAVHSQVLQNHTACPPGTNAKAQKVYSNCLLLVNKSIGRSFGVDVDHIRGRECNGKEIKIWEVWKK